MFLTFFIYLGVFILFKGGGCRIKETNGGVFSSLITSTFEARKTQVGAINHGSMHFREFLKNRNEFYTVYHFQQNKQN